MNPNRLVSAKDKDKNLDLKKQNSNKLPENNIINSKQSDKLVNKIMNNQDKNNKPLEIKKEKRELSSNLNNNDTTSTEATCNSDNNNLLKKRESDKKELKNIENFFDKKKENLNRYLFFVLNYRKSEPVSSKNINQNNFQKLENSNGDKKKIEFNDNNLLKKNSESESPDKKQIAEKIQEIKLSSKDGKEYNIPKVKIVDVKTNSKDDRINLNQKNSEKPSIILNIPNQAINENECELIEKHKMLIKLYNIEKGIDGEDNELETEVEKIKTEDVNSCTRDFNVVVVTFIL